jgi:hypothetical protein
MNHRHEIYVRPAAACSLDLPFASGSSLMPRLAIKHILTHSPFWLPTLEMEAGFWVPCLTMVARATVAPVFDISHSTPLTQKQNLIHTSPRSAPARVALASNQLLRQKPVTKQNLQSQWLCDPTVAPNHCEGNALPVATKPRSQIISAAWNRDSIHDFLT